MSVKLSDISIVKLGYSFREAIASEANGDISIVTAKSINDGILDLDSSIKIKNRNFKQDHFLEMNDIVINTRLNFKAAIYSSFEKSIVASPLIRARIIDSTDVLPEYLNIFLNSDRMQRQLYTLADTGAIPFISLSQVQSLEIVVPPMTRQIEIVNFNELIRKEILISSRIKTLKEKIYKTISDKLIFH